MDKKESCSTGFSACGGSRKRHSTIPPQCDPRGAFLSYGNEVSYTIEIAAQSSQLRIERQFFDVKANIHQKHPENKIHSFQSFRNLPETVPHTQPDKALSMHSAR